ncbi:MAG: penicillin-binding protein, partial [Rhodococcus sp. (in: high G+C Gram-positive bacteria)]|nr:penicillin-binding protein [Rhodococcus sp. (in: high G+C Gram-positive bacteria)]MDX5452849.1 penicillin-binding protein [Rhodococcus sp. (in: high G+C Gram-positive bacteria)]
MPILRRRPVPLLTTVVAALAAAGCSFGPDQPETVVGEFAAALEAGDVQAAADLTTDPAAAATTIGDVFDGLGVDGSGTVRPDVNLAGTGDAGTFDLDVAWTFGAGRDWAYRTSGSAVDLDPQGWRIEWDPALLAPDLTAGTTLSYTTTVGPAPSVLDRRGQP